MVKSRFPAILESTSQQEVISNRIYSPPKLPYVSLPFGVQMRVWSEQLERPYLASAILRDVCVCVCVCVCVWLHWEQAFCLCELFQMGCSKYTQLLA